MTTAYTSHPLYYTNLVHCHTSNARGVDLEPFCYLAPKLLCALHDLVIVTHTSGLHVLNYSWVRYLPQFYNQCVDGKLISNRGWDSSFPPL